LALFPITQPVYLLPELLQITAPLSAPTPKLNRRS
jgi:hypothetical protein